MNEYAPLPGGQVGRSLPRREARAKVTGRAEYVHNLRLPGMLHGKICRSTVPHARMHADRTRRRARRGGRGPGGHRRGHPPLIPDPYYGPAFHDQPMLGAGQGAATSASRWRSCSPTTATWPRRRPR